MPSPFFGIPDGPYNRCLQISDNVDAAWHNMVRIIRAENMALGITSSGKTKLITDALWPVMVYGAAGSLWEAYEALDNIIVTPQMAPFITKARVNWMKNQLQNAIAGL